jgi:type IV secretory pathway component VirB8
MKKQFIAIAAMVALLCSCGQKKTETAVVETANDTEVVEVVDPASETLAVSAEAETEPSSSQSNNWDALLDEYEDYMTQAVKMAKKAQSGDMCVMTEYASLLEKAQSLQKKLESAENDMTPAQVARLNKIATKLSQQMM